MIYQIHGQELTRDGVECGIYKSPNPLQRMEYAEMDTNALILAINSMSVKKAIEAVTQLRDTATQQAGWKHTPQNPGYPILRQLPEPSTSIDEVRGHIQNTERFCNDVLKVLQGK